MEKISTEDCQLLTFSEHLLEDVGSFGLTQGFPASEKFPLELGIRFFQRMDTGGGGILFIIGYLDATWTLITEKKKLFYKYGYTYFRLNCGLI